jgi:NADPH-dependent 2,4-dienoyl-CoA reductase/sulfur reductase-like enzyme
VDVQVQPSLPRILLFHWKAKKKKGTQKINEKKKKKKYFLPLNFPLSHGPKLHPLLLVTSINMASNHQTCDIVIVGAGVFGLTAAIELKTRQKEAKITVLDPGPVPHRHAASTDISKVIRMDYGKDELYVEMMVCAPR